MSTLVLDATVCDGVPAAKFVLVVRRILGNGGCDSWPDCVVSVSTLVLDATVCGCRCVVVIIVVVFGVCGATGSLLLSLPPGPLRGDAVS